MRGYRVSADNQCNLFFGDKAIYRIINPGHENDVIEVIEKVAACEAHGVIQTKFATQADLQNEGLEINGETLVLAHEKISVISYPHEWCAMMFKDATLFHLKLSMEILASGLHIKDAHPWNILFSKGTMVMVDLTSIVTKNALSKENYLKSTQHIKKYDDNGWVIDSIVEIYERMFKPYFFTPLLLNLCITRKKVRERIFLTTLGTSNEVLRFADLLKLPVNLLGAKYYLINLRYLLMYKFITIKLVINKNIKNYYKALYKLVSTINIEIEDTSYTKYYELKGENYSLTDKSHWGLKQKIIFDSLSDQSIDTVLDIACNTGWFSLMAESMGKTVIAFDIDEGCIERLYKEVKLKKLNIYPLVIDFSSIPDIRHSMDSQDIVLYPGVARLSCDAVIALAIIHHLVLGVGMSIDEVVSKLSKLAKSRLIIEYVDLDDALIKGDPSFFPAYFNNKQVANGYSLQYLETACLRHGFSVEIQRSHPSTRIMVVCTRIKKEEVLK